MIKSVEYLRHEDTITAHVVTEETMVATAVLDGKSHEDTSNRREPFEYLQHTFDFDMDTLSSCGEFTVNLVTKNYYPNQKDNPIKNYSYTVKFETEKIRNKKQAVMRSARKFSKAEVEREGTFDGLHWTQELYLTKEGQKLRVYCATVDLDRTEIIIGTPDAQECFEPGTRQNVMGEAKVIEENGKTVLLGVNGDFFDIFGDFHPSGLCMRDNKIVWNPDGDSIFFGVKTNGEPVVGHSKDYDLREIKEAISGNAIIVKDGEIGDTWPLLPFGEMRYPRSAFGFSKDNRAILMVVDGYNKAWSSGATMVEMALLMIEKGAYMAINADGGGSATFIARDNDSLSLINHPIGTNMPAEKDGRIVYNSVIVAARK